MRDKLTVLVLLALLALGLAAFLANHGALAVTGQVRDTETATPLAEAVISVLGRTVHSAPDGHYRLAAVIPGMTVVTLGFHATQRSAASTTGSGETGLPSGPGGLEIWPPPVHPCMISGKEQPPSNTGSAEWATDQEYP